MPTEPKAASLREQIIEIDEHGSVLCQEPIVILADDARP